MGGTLLFLAIPLSVSANWDAWWTYEGISGPNFWGLMNPEWDMCSRGKAQSPVNIDPGSIVYDPTLTQLHTDKYIIPIKMENTGQTLLMTVSNTDHPPINITGGPLQYTYRFTEIFLHWGSRDKAGSEHSINHHSFPAELQIFGYNSDLYPNISVARKSVRGLVAISLMIQVQDDHRNDHNHMHSGLGAIISKLGNIKYSGDQSHIKEFSLLSLLPSTGEYITYEGSTTYPGCWETVTWVIMNKPVYISSQEMSQFEQLSQSQGDDNMEGEDASLADNIRPRQNLNRRIVRTNIDLKYQDECKVESKLERQFQANAWLREMPTADLLSGRYGRGFY